MTERFVVDRGGALLAGERWPGHGPELLMVHEGVADRRSWAGVAERLTPAATVIAYDRRGCGESPACFEPFSHLDDLLAVIEQEAAGPAWIVGGSMGGGLALDAALAAPGRVRGLVLLAPAISGAPMDGFEEDLGSLGPLLDAAYEAGDLDEINRLETWLWLDGPSSPEGRVGGAVRELALDMNRIILGSGMSEEAGASPSDAWRVLGRIEVPVTVACGDLDVGILARRSRELAERLVQGRYAELTGVAHQANIEQPEAFAALVAGAVGIA